MHHADPIPTTGLPDSSIALLREGYSFIGNRCRRLGTDAFHTRLLLTDVICMTGPEAAERFYGGGRFTRRGAMPASVLKLLQDRGSVQMLEDDAHHHRKAMFMAMMAPSAVERLGTTFTEAWMRRLEQWQRASHVVLFNDARRILTETACAWAGVPLGAGELSRRTYALSEMIEGTGSIGPRNWRALMLRRQSELWAREVVTGIRRGELRVPVESPAYAIAWHRGADGRRLEPEIAAVELLNVIRPIVAVARFIVFAAAALHEHRPWRDAFASGDDHDLEHFAQEIRRLAPFFPFIGGRVRTAFDWHGHRFQQGQWVILDLYGTCRDPRAWDDPELFRPERFRGRAPDPFGFVPQGGGDHMSGHRCPGESISVALIMQAVRILTGAMRYTVPRQDLTIDLSRFPALPKSGFQLMNVARIS